MNKKAGLELKSLGIILGIISLIILAFLFGQWLLGEGSIGDKVREAALPLCDESTINIGKATVYAGGDIKKCLEECNSGKIPNCVTCKKGGCRPYKESDAGSRPCWKNGEEGALLDTKEPRYKGHEVCYIQQS